MILYDLNCANGHAFEAWFKDSKTFDRQAKASRIACPVCGGADVSKALMAPSIASGKSKDEAAKEYTDDAANTVKAFKEFRSFVEQNCDYVGNKFPEEARKIHYGDAEPRGIYGEASAEEVKELKEEGVACAPIPWPKNKDS